MLFPQAIQGKGMSSHFTPASVSVQVINQCHTFALCQEVNRGSNYHCCCLPNNSENIPFIFMDSSVFDHPPFLSKVSSSQGHIMGSASPAKGLAWLQLFCAHGQVSPWYEGVLTYKVSALKRLVAKQLFSSLSDIEEKWWCSTVDCHNLDQEEKTNRKK